MGIGQKLVDEREKLARNMGFKKAFITTTNHNLAVLHLMRKNGYKIRHN
jgi:ribosomal protein S18 acetylase RimI-like enzyme